MSKKKRRSDDNFFKCPGALYGNMPNEDRDDGNIAVGFEQVDQALSFLKRRYTVTGTGLSAHEDGLMIRIKKRG